MIRVPPDLQVPVEQLEMPDQPGLPELLVPLENKVLLELPVPQVKPEHQVQLVPLDLPEIKELPEQPDPPETPESKELPELPVKLVKLVKPVLPV